MRDATNEASAEEIDGLVQLTFAVYEILSRIAAALDLSMTQVRLLGILRDRTPTMAALAAYLQLDKSSVSGLIDRAARRGFVRRTTATHDARVTYVAITPDGMRLMEEAGSEFAAHIQVLLARLSAPQRGVLATLAATLTGAVDGGS